MEQIAVTRSIIDARALGDVIAREYPFEHSLSCRLISKSLRTQDNDHYLVTVDDRKYVARVYQLGKHLNRDASDYLYELDWLEYLRRHQMPVSYPIPRQDGGFLGQINAPEGIRYYALFSFAEGKPMSTEDEDQLYIMGAKMAQIHLISNEFKSQYRRQPMDLSFLVDQPVERIRQFWGNSRDVKLDILLTSADEAREEILGLLRDRECPEDSWGPIGGDFHPTNTHFDDENEPVFFNFDLCGSGWRAYDIAVFLLNADLMNKPARLSEAFFAGYYSVRPLSRKEHEAIAPFLTLRRVWLAGTFTAAEGVAGYTFVAPARLEGQ